MDNTTSSKTDEPHLILITTHGKIQKWVEFALNFLKENETRPLVLHTKREPRKSVPEQQNTNAQPQNTHTAPPTTVTTNAGSSSSARPEPSKPESVKANSSGVLNIPRLISVVEIIKREYLKSIPTGAAKRINGLHQYNEISVLEDTEDAPQMSREETLLYALEGKNHLKMKQTPFMRITLCRSEVPSLQRDGVSYQRPSVRTVTRSAQMRARKREKKKAVEAAGGGEAGGMDVGGS